jgi:hypothetical protein
MGSSDEEDSEDDAGFAIDSDGESESTNRSAVYSDPQHLLTLLKQVSGEGAGASLRIECCREEARVVSAAEQANAAALSAARVTLMETERQREVRNPWRRIVLVLRLLPLLRLLRLRLLRLLRLR